MEYVTVYEIFDRKQIPALKKLFDENKLDYRILEPPVNDTVPEGNRLQVVEEQKEKAQALLFENGFMKKFFSEKKQGSKSRFYLFLILTVVIIIIVSVLVVWYLG